jgi:hypothetical protein
LAEEPGREPGRCGFKSRRPPHGELSRWCAQRPVKPSPRHWWFDSTLTDSCPRGLAEGHRFPKPADTGSSPVEDARMYLVVCPSGQGSACKAEHAGSNPAAASEWPVAQRTEQRFPKPHCAGSSPAGPAIGHFPLWPGGGARLGGRNSTRRPPVQLFLMIYGAVMIRQCLLQAMTVI